VRWIDPMTFHDARAVDVATLAADICIVGAGAAGITLATELAGSSLRVIVLESGDFEFHHRPQLLYLGANVGLPSYSPARSRFRQFGGSTTRWGKQCRPLDPIDFESRPGIDGSGWPLTFAELEPYYRRAQRICSLGSFDYSHSSWLASDREDLRVATDRLETRIFQFSDPSDFGAMYREALGSARNVDVYLNANVIDIERAGDRVTGVRVATFTGRRLEVKARSFVLACGGIENARLLLAANGGAGGGIGNSHDLVGRYFMDHPYFLCGFFEPANPQHRRNAYVIEDYERVGTQQKANAAFALPADLLRAERLNGAAVYLVPRPYYKTSPEYFSVGGKSFTHLVDVLGHRELPNRDLGRHVLNACRGYRDVGRTLGRRVGELFRSRRMLALRAVIEATPNRQSRVRLGRSRDHFGMPRVDIDWRLNASDQSGLRRLLEVLRDETTRLGLGRIILDSSVDAAGWPASMTGGKHHIGTTRMHAAPHFGVVDPRCRVHECANLYVAGSSVFPTSGYANPTLTIVALAVRLSDHLKQAA
jgi:choline dehydrogenase-like flavoprotein